MDNRGIFHAGKFLIGLRAVCRIFPILIVHKLLIRVLETLRQYQIYKMSYGVKIDSSQEPSSSRCHSQDTRELKEEVPV